MTTPSGVADIRIVSISVPREPITNGQSFTVDVNITNQGLAYGKSNVELLVDDKVSETKQVELGIGEKLTVSFELKLIIEGPHSVSAGGILDKINVVRRQPILFPADLPSDWRALTIAELNFNSLKAFSDQLLGFGYQPGDFFGFQSGITLQEHAMVFGFTCFQLSNEQLNITNSALTADAALRRIAATFNTDLATYEILAGFDRFGSSVALRLYVEQDDFAIAGTHVDMILDLVQIINDNNKMIFAFIHPDGKFNDISTAKLVENVQSRITS